MQDNHLSGYLFSVCNKQTQPGGGRGVNYMDNDILSQLRTYVSCERIKKSKMKFAIFHAHLILLTNVLLFNIYEYNEFMN